MEAFSRMTSIVMATIMFFPLLFMQKIDIEKGSRKEKVENEISNLCEQIKKKREISSSDLLRLRELASALGGNLQICVGTKREMLLPENNAVYTYTDKIYFEDIQEIINTEGHMILLLGDSLSVSVCGKKDNNRIFNKAYNRLSLSTGGTV